MAVAHRAYETRDVQLASGLTLRCHEWPGEGPTVILLHGSSGYGLMWQGVADHLDAATATAGSRTGSTRRTSTRRTCTNWCRRWIWGRW